MLRSSKLPSNLLRRWGAAALLLFLASPAHLVLAEDLPADVAAFLEHRQQCEHFLGEEPYDAQRAAEIDAALDRYCHGTDARLAQLKQKYQAGPAAVRTVLGTLDDRIE